MSIGTLSNIWAQGQNSSQVQAAGNSGSANGTQTYSDWLTSLMSATGTTAGATPESGTAGTTLSDQMQALLMQLQGGNTAAPAVANTAATASTGAVTGSDATTVHHHHHHWHCDDGSSDQNPDDLFSNVADTVQGGDAPAAGSGSSATDGASAFFAGFQQSAGSMMSTLEQALQTYGAMALKGGATAALMAAV